MVLIFVNLLTMCRSVSISPTCLWESGVLDKSDRLRLLGQWVPERGSLRIEEAAGLLECSSMTVRRDVGGAPERFVLLGGHILVAGAGRLYDLNRELTVNVQAKDAVCANAIARLEDGDTIFIDCGTTTAPMANRLPANLRLTVVCYALNIAEPLARHSNVQLILLGGRYNASSASFEVADASSALSRLGINKAFLSAAGVHATRGVTCANFHEVAIKQAAIAAALEKHLLVDATKFGKVAPAAFAGLDEFDTITVSPAPDPGPEVERLGERLLVA
jgi:DeoR family transcriptional regulator, deoxyribose operon repressor